MWKNSFPKLSNSNTLELNAYEYWLQQYSLQVQLLQIYRFNATSGEKVFFMFLLPVFHSFLFNEHLLVPSLDPCFPLPCCTSNISILILVSHFLEQSSHFRFLNNCSSVRHPHMFNCSWPCSFNILKVAMNSVSQQEMQELELDVVNAKPFKFVVLLIIGKGLTFFLGPVWHSSSTEIYDGSVVFRLIKVV